MGTHTKEANQAEINKNGTSAKAGTCPHEQDDEQYSNKQIDLESQCRDGTPHIIRLQFGLLRVGTQDDGDDTANGNDNAQKVPLTEAFVEHERGDEAVRDERDDAQW